MDNVPDLDVWRAPRWLLLSRGRVSRALLSCHNQPLDALPARVSKGVGSFGDRKPQISLLCPQLETKPVPVADLIHHTRTLR